MSLLRDDHRVEVGGSTISVEGRTGPIKATWRVLVDGRLVNEDRLMKGRRSFLVPLREGGPAEVEINQGAFGPTTVIVRRDGEVAAQFRGFVA